VTIFIVIGIVLVIMLILTVYLVSILTPTEPGPKEVNSKTVKAYIEGCLSQIGANAVDEIGKKGGTFHPEKLSYWQGDLYHFLCYQEPTIAGCVNPLLTKQDMEKELSQEIKDRIGSCIDLPIFERRGFDVEDGEMDVDVTIAEERVILRMDYYLAMSRDNTAFVVEDYEAEVGKPLGKLYSLSMDIVNMKNSGIGFDTVDFMVRTGAEVIVQRHRLYPNEFFDIEMDTYIFRFAIEGRDTSLRPGSYRLADPLDTTLGCCYVDSACYKNVPESLCTLKGGSYNPSGSCTCSYTDFKERYECPDGRCDDCEKTFSYVTKRYTNKERLHGESWCSYEAKAGKGYDYVGSTHYLHYCIDGVEYVEECRDYRDQICTEEKVEIDGQEANRAVCRVNRWQDCLECETEECCNDRELRDCVWKDWIATEQKCVPYVPPGFRHWDSIGHEICLKASETKECEGSSCPNIWVDDAARLCHMVGDCGEYRNVADVLTRYGYLNTDPQDDVRIWDFELYREGLHMKGDDYTINLGIHNTRQETILSSRYAEMQDMMVKMMASVYQYLERIDDYSLTDFLNPFSDQPEIYILDFAVCQMWLPPPGGEDCHLCNENPMWPCTEYRCKSLGQNCEFENHLGKTRCYSADEKDKSPPKVDIIEESLTPGYSIEDTQLRIYDKEFDGYRIEPALRPFFMFRLTINTSEDARCSLRYGPKDKYIKSPSFPIDSSKIGTKHNISLRVPPRVEFPERISDILNITTITELGKMLERPEQMARELREKYSEQIELASFASGKDIDKKIDEYMQKGLRILGLIRDMMPYYRELIDTILAKFEKGGYYFFIECTDRAGNTNSEQVFLDLTIAGNEDDRIPPVIVGANPANNSRIPNDQDNQEVSIYLNEPSECSYSFQPKEFSMMERNLDCTDSLYDISPFFSGSYLCRDTISLNESNTTLYIICRDNPLKRSKRNIRIRLGKSMGTIGARSTQLTNVTYPNDIHASESMLTDSLIFRVTDLSPTLNLYKERKEVCNLTYNNRTQQFQEITTNKAVEVGLYRYKADLFLRHVNPRLSKKEYLISFNMTDSLSRNTTWLNMTDEKLAMKLHLIPESLFLDGSVNISLRLKKPSQLEFVAAGNHSCLINKTEIACDRNMTHTTCNGQISRNSRYNLTCIEIDGQGDPVLIEEFNITIDCVDKERTQQNTMPGPVEYKMIRSNPLVIVEKYPQGEVETLTPTIRVITTENPDVRCGLTNRINTPFLEMQKLEDKVFEYQLKEQQPGTKLYYIRCFDQYLNHAETEVEFVVI
jgi:hypothetical protein